MDEHALIKSKVVKSASVPYMNSALRKAQYKHNMARNKLRNFGNTPGNRIDAQKNHVIIFRKKNQCEPTSKKNFSKHDKNFWATIYPFFTDKRFRNANKIILRENDNIVTDPSSVPELFTDCVAMGLLPDT